MLNRIELEIQALESIIEFNDLDMRLNELIEISCIRKEDWTYRYNKNQKMIVSEKHNKIFKVYTIMGRYYSLFLETSIHGIYVIPNSKYFYWKENLLL